MIFFFSKCLKFVRIQLNFSELLSVDNNQNNPKTSSCVLNELRYFKFITISLEVNVEQ